MVGAITEIILVSGLDKVLKIKTDTAKPFFKRYGLEFRSEFKSDMKKLGEAARKAKEGLGFKKPKFKTKPKNIKTTRPQTKQAFLNEHMGKIPKDADGVEITPKH